MTQDAVCMTIDLRHPTNEVREAFALGHKHALPVRAWFGFDICVREDTKPLILCTVKSWGAMGGLVKLVTLRVLNVSPLPVVLALS